MNPAHIEINFQRLLQKCEDIADNQNYESWRFEKYVFTLEDFLKKMNRSMVNKPSQDSLKEYSRKVEFLKQLTSNKKAIGNDFNFVEPKHLTNPGPIMTNKDVKPKQIYHKVQVNQENYLREQLLGVKTLKNDSGDIENVDMNKLLMQQQQNQEKIAFEMLKSVESIKNNSLLAKDIITKDNKALSKLNSEAEKNTDNLKLVNDHLSTKVSRSCNCWIWLMILLIMMVFVMMVLFMKLFPKRKNYSSITNNNFISIQENLTNLTNVTNFLENNQTFERIDL